ncbi:hypothetical protein ADL26_19340, partial [Thermoactinomyces vulgaris]
MPGLPRTGADPDGDHPCRSALPVLGRSGGVGERVGREIGTGVGVEVPVEVPVQGERERLQQVGGVVVAGSGGVQEEQVAGEQVFPGAAVVQRKDYALVPEQRRGM